MRLKWGNLQTMQAARSDGQKDRSRFVWTEKSSQQSLPKACWNTLQKDSPLKSGNLRLRCRARATVRCSLRGLLRLEDVKKLTNWSGEISALKKVALGCPVSDRWGVGIHFASASISAKSISSHRPVP